MPGRGAMISGQMSHPREVINWQIPHPGEHKKVGTITTNRDCNEFELHEDDHLSHSTLQAKRQIPGGVISHVKCPAPVHRFCCKFPAPATAIFSKFPGVSRGGDGNSWN